LTRKEAATKYAKLIRLADGNSNPHEAESARQQAANLASEYSLKPSDLESERLNEAFDDLVVRLEEFIAMKESDLGGLFGAGPIVKEVTSKIRTSTEIDKPAYLRKFTAVLRMVSLVSGGNSPITTLKKILDEVLKKHNLAL